MDKRKKWIYLSIAAGTLCLVCAIITIVYICGIRKADRRYEEIEKEAVKSESLDTERPTEDSEILPDITVDFDNIISKNPDIYAWIYIPETSVSYPIVQNPSDDEYYLTHTVDKAEAASGSIYTQSLNNKDFEDPNTVIYGHNMKNGTMFAGLHKFEKKEFFDANDRMYIYTPNCVFIYEIFAAYTYSDKHILYSFDFSSKEDYARYIEEIMNIRTMNAYYREGVKPTVENKLVTLSTCVGGGDSNYRYIVQGLLISKKSIQ